MILYRLNLYFVVIILFGKLKEVSLEHDSLPEYLIECYDSPVVLLPMTTTTLIDIIRKIECNEYYFMDVRMLANSILNRFWRDGIERDPNVLYHDPNVIPYKTSGFQSYKYKLLYSQLLPTSGFPFPNNTLTLEERCTLHFMLSSTIDVWERGDEYIVCPLLTEQKQISSYESSGARKSSCPIEKGIISAKEFSSLSPNHVFGAIAAALQPMDVAQQLLMPNSKTFVRPKMINWDIYNKTVNNLWAATFTGDLAEVIVFQTPLSEEVYLGPHNSWNDSSLPTTSYIKADYNIILKGFWHFTDAEIFGAVDGMILADEVLRFSNILSSLKLSQILEMYYTNRGGEFPNQIRVCDRKNYFFSYLLPKGNLLNEQTFRFAEVLAANAPHAFIDNQYIEDKLAKVFIAFKYYVSQLISSSKAKCPYGAKYRARLNLYAIYDSTWSDYETLQVLMQIADQTDVGYYGSNFTVINGIKGKTVVDSATTIGEIYLTWRKVDPLIREADSTDIHRGFLALKSLLNSDGYSNIPSSYVTLVIAPSSPISDHSYELIYSTVKSIKSQIPDMKFIYITSTSNSRPLVKLTALPGSQDDKIITIDHRNKYNLFKELEILEEVPRTLNPPPCRSETTKFQEFSVEEYISPGINQIYRIHPIFLCSSKEAIDVKILNSNYGLLEVCVMREQKETLGNSDCFVVPLFNETIYTIRSPCTSKIITNKKEDWDQGCRPIFIKVFTKRSYSRCTERGCRFPDDLRFTITINGLRCLKYPILCDKCSHFTTSMSLLFTTVILLWINMNKY